MTDNNAATTPTWVPIAGFAVGIAAVLFFMALAVASMFGHQVPCESRFLVVAIIGFTGSLALGLWGGSIAARGAIPLPFATQHPIAFAAGGGIAALVVLLGVGHQLYSERDCTKPKQQIDADISAMLTNLNGEHYDAALLKAQDVLNADPRNFRALNVQGSVAFYRRQFNDAVKYFGEAHRANPTNRIIAWNLADAYVETEAYDLALDKYQQFTATTPAWHYANGRANLYAGKYDEAVKHLAFAKADSPRRSANVLLSAALVGQADSAADATRRNRLLTDARRELHTACESDAAYWNAALVGGKRVKEETYEKIFPLLGRLYVHSKPCH